MYKISLVIPVYNMEKYLKDLLESVINQTMNYKEVQVIIIDDCSTDNSWNIIQEYIDKYDNFIAKKLVCNNCIAGKARNEGIELATGKYLMFSDGDDFFPRDAFEVVYNAIEKRQADVLNANYINVDEDMKLWPHPIFNQERYKDFKISITDYKDSFFVYNSSACNKVFKREFIMKNNIRFLEGVPAEDAYFTAKCLLNTDKIYYINYVMYCYRQRNRSLNNRSVSFNCSREYFRKINYSYRKIYELYKEYNQIRFYRYVYAKNMSYMLYKLIDSPIITDEERIEVMKEMEWFYRLSIELKVPACQIGQKFIIDKILLHDYQEAINYCQLIRDIRTYIPKEIKEDMSRPTSDMYQNISRFDREF